jgi:hypothetical protein
MMLEERYASVSSLPAASSKGLLLRLGSVLAVSSEIYETRGSALNKSCKA